jgi:iron(II)-dependent oxidoreductase
VLQAEGWRIAGTCRSEARRDELAALGIEAWLFDREQPLADPAGALAGSTHLLSSVPPDAAGDPVIDLCGPAIAARHDLAWIGYLSTTGVYGDHGGGWVDETTALTPSGEDMVRRDLAEVYDAFETPRHGRGDLPFLGPDDAREYLAEVRERALAATERLGPGDGLVHELVVRHEHQHNETMLQTMALARLDCFDPAEQRAAPPAPGGHTGLELVDVPGGPCEVGAPAAGFAYDNERPRHGVELGAFRIARRPVTNATWLHFTEGGGYQRREWWSDEGWAWKEDYDIGACPDAEAGHPDAPVCHVSWFEADAFARAQGARLPTEFEWERAATWDQRTQSVRAPSPRHANLDQRAFGTQPVGAYPEGASPSVRRRS